jgi:endonuclease/exonuclease/phosphatase family metal-dependent hydrolase
MLKVLRIAVLVCFFPALVQSQQLNLKVMTFNIRYDNPGDGDYRWALRLPMVTEVVRSENPDIIGMQEVLKNQLTDLEKILPDYTHVGVGRDDGKDQGEFAPVFFKSNRFDKRAEGTFWLSETPDVPGSKSWGTACTRIVTWVKLYDKRFRRKVFVFNTHFDHVSKEARNQSAYLLISAIHQVAGKNWVIVTGDFNDREGSSMYKILTGTTLDLSLFNTARTSRTEPMGPDYTYIGFPFQPESGNTIDFIFTRSNVGATVTRHQVITFNVSGKYPSDHLPVATEFELKLKKRRYALE